MNCDLFPGETEGCARVLGECLITTSEGKRKTSSASSASSEIDVGAVENTDQVGRSSDDPPFLSDDPLRYQGRQGTSRRGDAQGGRGLQSYGPCPQTVSGPARKNPQVLGGGGSVEKPILGSAKSAFGDSAMEIVGLKWGFVG